MTAQTEYEVQNQATQVFLKQQHFNHYSSLTPKGKPPRCILSEIVALFSLTILDYIGTPTLTLVYYITENLYLMGSLTIIGRFDGMFNDKRSFGKFLLIQLGDMW
jgi:hypothetical protein